MGPKTTTVTTKVMRAHRRLPWSMRVAMMIPRLTSWRVLTRNRQARKARLALPPMLRQRIVLRVPQRTLSNPSKSQPGTETVHAASAAHSTGAVTMPKADPKKSKRRPQFAVPSSASLPSGHTNRETVEKPLVRTSTTQATPSSSVLSNAARKARQQVLAVEDSDSDQTEGSL